MKKTLTITIGIWFLFLFGCQKITIDNADTKQITSFETCIAAGFLATDNNPRVCSDGTNVFVEEIIQDLEENEDYEEIDDENITNENENLTNEDITNEDMVDTDSEIEDTKTTGSKDSNTQDNTGSQNKETTNDLTILQQKLKESIQKRNETNNTNNNKEEGITEKDIDKLENIINQIIQQ